MKQQFDIVIAVDDNDESEFLVQTEEKKPNTMTIHSYGQHF